MSEGAEGGAGTVAVLLDIVTPRRLVDLGVKLLLGASVAVLAALTVLAAGRVAPLVRLLDVRARCRSVVVVGGGGAEGEERGEGREVRRGGGRRVIDKLSKIP